jgi:hypothetical protein
MTIRFRNGNNFRNALRSFGKRAVPADALKLQQRISLDLLRRIVFKNPVDTGRSRGNWQTTVGASNDSEIEPQDPIAAGTIVVAGAQPYGVITLFNNVKYIKALENGSSQQAPLGMVKVSIAETNLQFG